MDSLKKRLGSQWGNTAIISVFIVFALFIIVGTHYGTKTLSAVRAYVGAEGQWTKAQKEATTLLIRYNDNEQPKLYEQFQQELELHKAFKRSRQTLTSQAPNYDLAFRGFETADIHSDDIKLLIWLAQFHANISYLQKAFEVWKQGDRHIAKLDTLGRTLHETIQEEPTNHERRTQLIQDIYELDQTLTKLENSFSANMAEGAREIRSVLFWSIAGLGIIIILTGYIIMRNLFSNINILNQELVESETKFRSVLQNSRDVVYQIDFDSGNYEYMSPAVKDMLGYSPDQILEQGTEFVLDRIHPEDLKRMDQEIEEMKGKGVENHFAGETEFRIKTKDGNYIWVNNKRSLVKDDNGNPTAIVGTVRDISTRKKHEVQTQKSLEEKQTLLEEVHHRVKNNLGVVLSLLELQKKEADNELKSLLQETQSRIHSIGMIHEKLYQTETLSDIDIKEYIEDFANMIASSFNSEQKDITITKDVQSFNLETTKAVPVGLILNELLNNAYQHGFSDTKSGELRITFKKEDEEILFRVADNGRGLPDGFSLSNQQSLGMTLIQRLTKQLKGELEVFSEDEWTIFQVTFP
ncbi:PAS domain S-box-containing protein [Fodinibius salinus]|uniref:histidine kinase n=1 Tax=Fodinibius salinus TaxID=860790 RepID=A0A5D3YIE1_9BACT|nr:histidine kinase dimerization/phosphoacceptor domain -containing protein [Fodinibius salinus]TYP93614.1 PAS domain S-box-containing protein [Fodinibius salinus]